MIRFAICDDDQNTTGFIDHLILSLKPLYDQEFEISVFFSGENFCDYLNASNDLFDIVLMDIEMRGITGVDAGRTLRKNIANDLTLLIFVSSHKSYYHEIVDLNVFCFIPKPIFVDEFNLKLYNAINKVIRLRQLPQYNNLIINKNKSEILIPIRSIMYLESNSRKINLHTESEVIEYYGSLDLEDNKLPKTFFIRVHKSFIVNFLHISTITSKDLTMKDNRNISISSKYREKAKTAYLNYRGKVYEHQ